MQVARAVASPAWYSVAAAFASSVCRPQAGAGLGGAGAWQHLVHHAAVGQQAAGQPGIVQAPCVAAGVAVGHAGVVAQQPGPLEMVAGFEHPAGIALGGGQARVEVFRQACRAGLPEAGGEQAEHLARAGQEAGVAGGVVPGQHRLEQVHVRVLQPRAGGLVRAVQQAAAGGGEVRVEQFQDGARLAFQGAVVGQLVGPGQREQREGVRVGVPPGVSHAAVRIHREHEARPCRPARGSGAASSPSPSPPGPARVGNQPSRAAWLNT